MSGSPQPTAVLVIAASGEMDGIRRRQHSLPSSSPITTTCSPTPSSRSLICCSLTFYILPLNPSLITRWVHREAISQRLDYRLSPCGVISSPPPLHLHPDSALTPSTVLASVYTVCNYCLSVQPVCQSACNNQCVSLPVYSNCHTHLSAGLEPSSSASAAAGPHTAPAAIDLPQDRLFENNLKRLVNDAALRPR